MSLVLTFCVPGAPVPKGRPRLGNGGNIYTPRDTKVYERTVAVFAVQAMRLQNWPMKCLEPCAIEFRFFLPDGRRVDLDNLEKCAMDAANGLIFADDSQVVSLKATKTMHCASPRMEVEVRTIDDRKDSAL